MIVLTIFILQILFGITLYYTAWIWSWISANKLSADTLKHGQALLTELRSFITMDFSPPVIAGVTGFLVLLVDKDHDLIPDKIEDELKNGIKKSGPAPSGSGFNIMKERDSHDDGTN